MGEKIVTSCARNLTRSLPSGVKSGSWPPQRHTGPLTEGCFSFVGPKSCQSAIVEGFGRREASESLRCPNRGGHEPSYGESCFALMVGKPGAAQNRTYLRSDRLNMDGESGRRKADGGILRFRRLLLGSAVASGVASRRGCALDRVCARPCRVTAQVSRMRPQAGAARGADSGARRPR